MSKQITCLNGCCAYSQTGDPGGGPGWNHWPVGCYVYFCPHDGTRLNADGTANAGSAAWRDHEAMGFLRATGDRADVRCIDIWSRDGGWVSSVEDTDDNELAFAEEDDPADAILAAKAALEVSADETDQG